MKNGIARTFVAGVACVAAAGAIVSAEEPLRGLAAGVSVTAVVTPQSEEAGEFPSLAVVQVRNDTRRRAAFDLVLIDGRSGRGVAREPALRLEPGESRSFALSTPPSASGPDLRAVALAPSPFSFAIGATTATGLPPGTGEKTWNLARGEVTVTPLEGERTRFEVKATGLRPGALYSLWWIDGVISPTGGPLAPPPANQVRPDVQGNAVASVTAAFGSRVHDRLVLALHISGDGTGADRDQIGKTIFAHLLGSIAPERRARRG